MFKETVKLGDALGVGAMLNSRMAEEVVLGRAAMRVTHMRAKDFKKDKKTGLLVPDYRWKSSEKFGRVEDGRGEIDLDSAEVLYEDEVYNLITNAGRIFLHKQGYDTTGLGANGLNYIALSNDTVTETATSTTLSTEIAANGLTRAQGTVTLPTGSGNQTTIAKTFTASGSQSAQKAALFTASSAGTMNHVLAFTQRSLITSDTLAVTYTITLG